MACHFHNHNHINNSISNHNTQSYYSFYMLQVASYRYIYKPKLTNIISDTTNKAVQWHMEQWQAIQWHMEKWHGMEMSLPNKNTCLRTVECYLLTPPRPPRAMTTPGAAMLLLLPPFIMLRGGPAASGLDCGRCWLKLWPFPTDNGWERFP